MKKGLFILLILCFSLTVFSCSDDTEEYTDSTTTAPIEPDAVFHNGVYWQREYKRIGTDVDGLTYCSDLEYRGRTNLQIPNYDNLSALYNSPNDNMIVDSFLPFYPMNSTDSSNKCGGISMTNGGTYNITNNSTGCAITTGYGTLCMSEYLFS